MPTPAVYKAVVKLNAVSGIPADAVENTFTFVTTDNLPANRIAIRGLLDTFYTQIPATGVKAVGGWLGGSLDRVALPSVTIYDVTAHLSGSAAGAPVSVLPFLHTLPAATGAALPAEVAACLSFHGDYGLTSEFGSHTRPRARLRGRIYLGPLLQSTLTVDAVTNRVKLSTSAMIADTIKAATALKASVDPVWVVWSRTGASQVPVTGGWMDDAYDTQRRRGEAPIARSSF